MHPYARPSPKSAPSARRQRTATVTAVTARTATRSRLSGTPEDEAAAKPAAGVVADVSAAVGRAVEPKGRAVSISSDRLPEVACHRVKHHQRELAKCTRFGEAEHFIVIVLQTAHGRTKFPLETNETIPHLTK